ncbi:hypothetical protein [Sphaerisporangium sp. NPDC051011]|uniref:hypothetical protein n=1 Tax=Sphaerisporangium sp. NPDC051011 TaxID=3155792 RepID=UPI0033F10BD0
MTTLLGMSSRAKLCGRALALALLPSLAFFAACTSDKGLTVAQAGQNLQSHVLQLLKERNAGNVTVTDPGGKNVSCAGGKVKRTFAATGTDLPQRKPDALVDSLLGALKRVATYEIISTGEPGQPIRVENKSAGTILVLSSPTSGVYDVHGETVCLDI